MQLDAPADATGVRLDRFLAARAAVAAPDSALFGVSRARLQRLIVDGLVTVAGAKVRPSYKLRPGEQVRVSVPAPEPLDLTPEPMPLSILYEDEHLIAVDKPAGLSVHPGAGRKTGTLVHALLAHCKDLSGIGGKERPGIVHRLDKDTSGVVVVAKHDRAHRLLAAQFALRQVKKTYVAFVFGVPLPKAATIETVIGRHPSDRKRFTTKVRRGRSAVTHYQVVASKGGISRVLIDLGTGRTHQIRVHFSERGHPVVGDPVYGGRQWRRVTDPALRKVAERLNRQALHALSLGINHPISGVPLLFEAPLPAELRPLTDLVG
ncbi:MAG: RluA family pseudouridine synthase [Deltaproteobacteria bacterium]|nr:RluA family pseudouridine synthase [Deltaproteobacteria bacterium]